MVIKISELTALSATPDTSDIVPIVDISVTTTKKVTITEFMNAVQAWLQTSGLSSLAASGSPVAGAIRYSSGFQGYNGSTWVALDVQSTAGSYWNLAGSNVELASGGYLLTLGNGSAFSVNNITVAGITPTATVMLVQGNGGAIDITTNPQIAAGIPGQILILVGNSDTNTLQLDDGAGLSLNGGVEMVLGLNSIVQLIYIGSTWVELSRKA